LTSNYS